MSATTVVLAGLALGAAIAVARGIGRDDDERHTAELERLKQQTTSDDMPIGATEGNGARTDDVSLVAQRLSGTTSQVDAR